MNEKEKILEKASLVLVKDILHLEKGQKFLIYVDQGSDIEVAKVIQSCAEKNGVQTSLLELNIGPESTDRLKELLKRIENGNFDAICELSAQFFFMTVAWKKASELGCRTYSLGAVDTNSFIRCVGQSDHMLMYQFGTALAKTLRQAKSIQILTEQGTHIEFKMNPSSLLNRTLSKLRMIKGASQRSWIWLPSTFMAGQVALQGSPKTIEGMAVIDGYIWPPEEINPIDEPIILNIKKGSVVEISGCSSKSEILTKWLNGKEKKIKHFCIGFNPGADLSGKIMEAERVFGSVSLGFGKHPFHTDGIFENASLLMNGQMIIENGEFVHKDLSILGKDLIQHYHDSKG
jgi:leucyl aminopeptidase (aminopeptidase T)